MALEVLITQALGVATVDLESNVAPPVRVFDVRDTGPSLLDVLGVKTRLVARRDDGSIRYEFGAPVGTDYVLAAALVTVTLAAVVLLGAAVGRLVR